MVEHLVFLDESGVNTDLTRLYGRAPSSQRAVDHAPLNTPKTTTVLSSIRLDGEKAFTTYQGGTTGERFVQYLKETLLPTLRPGDIVVMDNMRSHHVKAVRETLEAKNMKVLYLPPYSPDLNPIEKMWSKMKAILRGWKIREMASLPDAIHNALTCVSPLDCLHWFASSAYCYTARREHLQIIRSISALLESSHDTLLQISPALSIRRASPSGCTRPRWR